MTTVYFVRHAEPNYNNHDDAGRELSEKGLKDRSLVTDFLTDKNIDAVFSSPFKRAYDTISEFAKVKNLEISVIDDFRERKVDSIWIEDFHGFSKKQWEDFSYRLSDGESLGEVQERNICALNEILTNHKDKTVVVGSHGTALSTVVNYYDPNFCHSDFERIKNLMPWIVRFRFEEIKCVDIKEYNLFER